MSEVDFAHFPRATFLPFQKLIPPPLEMTFRSNKTVLVLGAGASHPYGFPLGAGLKDAVMEGLGKKTSEQWKAFNGLGFREDEIHNFKSDLESAHLHGTIDEYLRHKPSRRRLGTCAMAVVLSSLENPDRVSKVRDWYRELALGLKLDSTDGCPISGIITFNYERSLQFILTKTATDHFEGEVQKRALAKVNGIPIVHVHGSLGPLSQVPFHPVQSSAALDAAASTIALVHDDALHGSAVFEQARDLIKSANEVYFIGWAWDPRGIDRLGLRSLDISRKKLAGTAFGLTNRNEVWDMFGKAIYLPENMNASDFMKEMNVDKRT